MASSNYGYDGGWKKKLPIGFRFMPTDKELNMYLKLKSCDGKIPPGIFTDVDIYEYEPQQLFGFGEKHWDGRMYFFSPLRKKYGSGSRSERIIHSGKGVWRASQARKSLSKQMCDESKGTKTSLVYYELDSNNSSNSKKTGWLMLEYRFPIKLHPLPLFNGTNDELTLCVIYYHGTKKYNDDQIAMSTTEPNDPIPLQSPINQNSDHSVPYTSHQEINLHPYNNFVSSSVPIQQYQPQSYTDHIATTSIMQPSFPQLEQVYTDVAATSTMQLSFPQLPYDGVMEYLNLDNFYYEEDEEMGHIPNSNVDIIDQNKLKAHVAPVSQKDQRPSSGSQDHDDHQQLNMKKIRI